MCRFVALCLLLTAAAGAQPRRVLYLTHSAGYRHDSIPVSVAALRDAARESGKLEIVATEDVSVLNATSLASFDAVLFFTSGELPVTEAQKAALLDFVRGGKGFAGVHSATDTFYTWPEYGALIGARFSGHPWVQSARFDTEDPAHPAMAPVQPSIEIVEEIYQFRDFSRARSRVLLTVDPHTVNLGAAGVNPATEDFPAAWCHTYGSGRVFYSAYGHFDETWRDQRFQRMMLGALLWITRQVDGDAAPRPLAQPAIAATGESAALNFRDSLAPGAWFSIFGSGLTPGSTAAAGVLGPVRKLAGAVVKVNRTPVPLSYASPGQINAWLPFELSAPRFEVSIGSASVSLAARDATPGVFAMTRHEGYISIWANGLGPVVDSRTRFLPAVRIGDATATVTFSGLAPGWLGLYQVNALLPPSYPSPARVELCFENFCQTAGWLH